METTVKFKTLSCREARTYLFAAVFVLGNMLLPQLCHLVPQGGLVWLPIYFFTLIGAYKYGWQVGLLTAVASAVICLTAPTLIGFFNSDPAVISFGATRLRWIVGCETPVRLCISAFVSPWRLMSRILSIVGMSIILSASLPSSW